MSLPRSLSEPVCVCVCVTQDEFHSRCTNEYMAVGGVLYADLLALPPPAKHIKQWVLRQVRARRGHKHLCSTGAGSLAKHTNGAAGPHFAAQHS